MSERSFSLLRFRFERRARLTKIYFAPTVLKPESIFNNCVAKREEIVCAVMYYWENYCDSGDIIDAVGRRSTASIM